MSTEPDSAPAANNDDTGSDGTTESTIIGGAEFTGKALNGEINPDEWQEI